MTVAQRPRPVYVLGAGFSRAVSAAMPLTDELGATVKSRLRGLILEDLSPDMTFEDWLSLRVAELPFLQGWDVSRRRADAERVIAEIASVLDERVAQATSEACPEWLIQLVGLWHAERAVVITFNYDTLVERAVNQAQMVAIERGRSAMVFADQVVTPAPPGPPALMRADEAVPVAGSFTLMKLHGSLNWYWSAGDPTGSTLTRTRERGLFGAESLIEEATDFGGTRTLDRFLIPPVSIKNEYYSPYLTHTLWRSAFQALQSGGRLTLMGYSMPKTDQVGTQLLASIPPSAAVEVVDVGPGEPDDRMSLISRASRLNGSNPLSWSGPSCLPAYVAHRVGDAAAGLRMELQGGDLENVLVAFPVGKGLNATPTLFTLVDAHEGELQVADLDNNGINRSEMPPIEMSLQIQPRGRYSLEQFMTVGRLRSYLAAGHRPMIRSAYGRSSAVGAEALRIGPWDLTVLAHIPLS
ncbi:hypothetical protein [Leifsonia shinshuensis]